MKKYSRVACSIVALCLLSWPCFAETLYVAPNGDDANPGTKEKPFRSIDRARDALRALNAVSPRDCDVVLTGGVYVLDAPVVFDARDGGDGNTRIAYRAESGERPVLSGRRSIADWQPDEHGRWRAKTNLPDFRQLYVNGVRAVRARGPFPEGGERYGNLEFIDGDAGHTLPGGDLPDWRNPGDMEFGYFNSWSHMICKVRAIAREADGSVKIAMQQPGFFLVSRKEGVQAQMPDYIENAFELLDEPGEWYFDKSAGTVYYLPRENEDMAKADVFAPLLETLVEIRATLDAPVRNLRFEGLTFADATWLAPNRIGHADVQANFTMVPTNIAERDGSLYNIHNEQRKSPANVVVHTGDAVAFDRCEFTRLGGAGLDIEYGSKNVVVTGCRFHDISGSAIQIGDVTSEDHHPNDPRGIVENNRVVNNYIYDIGVEYEDSIGVCCGYVRGTVIAHNEIASLPYSGVSIGWGWGEEDAGGGNYAAIPYRYAKPTPAGGNRIEFNHIHDVMLRRNDGGGIYTLSNQPGTVIRGNHIHDSGPGGGPGGIYLDEGSGFIEIVGNCVYNVPTPMNYNNRAQDRIDTCNEHDNVFGIAPGSPDFREDIARNAGLEESYRGLLR